MSIPKKIKTPRASSYDPNFFVHLGSTTSASGEPLMQLPDSSNGLGTGVMSSNINTAVMNTGSAADNKIYSDNLIYNDRTYRFELTQTELNWYSLEDGMLKGSILVQGIMNVHTKDTIVDKKEFLHLASLQNGVGFMVQVLDFKLNKVEEVCLLSETEDKMNMWVDMILFSQRGFFNQQLANSRANIANPTAAMDADAVTPSLEPSGTFSGCLKKKLMSARGAWRDSFVSVKKDHLEWFSNRKATENNKVGQLRLSSLDRIVMATSEEAATFPSREEIPRSKLHLAFYLVKGKGNCTSAMDTETDESKVIASQVILYMGENIKLVSCWVSSFDKIIKKERFARELIANTKKLDDELVGITIEEDDAELEFNPIEEYDLDEQGHGILEERKKLTELLSFVPQLVISQFFNTPQLKRNKKSLLDLKDNLVNNRTATFKKERIPTSTSRNPQMTAMPDATVLFADISGFTPLAESLAKEGEAKGAEILSQHLNRYFSQIVEVIEKFGGDVIKYAGDALIATWTTENLFTNVYLASICSREIQTRTKTYDATVTFYTNEPEEEGKQPGSSINTSSLSNNTIISGAVTGSSSSSKKRISSQHSNSSTDYKIIPHIHKDLVHKMRRVDKKVTLTLHIGIATGEIYGLNLGGIQGRWEYLLAGDTLKKVSAAEGAAKSGEIVMDNYSYDIIKEYAKGDLISGDDRHGGDEKMFRLDSIVKLEDLIHIHNKNVRIPNAQRPTAYTLSSFANTINKSRNSSRLTHKPSIVTTLAIKKEASDRRLLQQFIGYLQGYIPLIVRHRLDIGLGKWMAELIKVTILFCELPNLQFTNNIESLNKLDSKFRAMQKIVYAYDGMIRQFIIDDKGCVLIAAFSGHEDDPIRGIKCGLGLQSTLQCSVGVTTGKVFMGAVGSEVRREFAMVGDTVNLAARLMGQAHSNVFCDNYSFVATKNFKNHGLDFKGLPPINLKGKKNEIPIFNVKHNPFGVEQYNESTLKQQSRVHIIGESRNRAAERLERAYDILVEIHSQESMHCINQAILTTEPVFSTKLPRINPIISMNNAASKHLDENNDFSSMLFLISGTEGMGKTTILNHLKVYAYNTRKSLLLRIKEQSSKNNTLIRPQYSSLTPSHKRIVNNPSVEINSPINDLNIQLSAKQRIKHLPFRIDVLGDQFSNQSFSAWRATLTKLMLNYLHSDITGYDQGLEFESSGSSPSDPKSSLLHGSLDQAEVVNDIFSEVIGVYNKHLSYFKHNEKETGELSSTAVHQQWITRGISEIIKAARFLYGDVYYGDDNTYPNNEDKKSSMNNFIHNNPMNSATCDLLTSHRKVDSLLMRDISKGIARILVFLSGGKKLFVCCENSETLDDWSWDVLLALKEINPFLLVVITTRHESDLPKSFSIKTKSFHSNVFKMTSLSMEETSDLIGVKLSAEKVSEPVTRMLYTKCKGNPYYICQLVFYLREKRHLTVVNIDSHMTAVFSDKITSPSDIKFPEKLGDAIISALSRLSAMEQFVLKVASVIGLDFGLTFGVKVLQMVYPALEDRDKISQCLMSLMAKDLVVCNSNESDTIDPNTIDNEFFQFSQPIVADTCYNLLLFNQRIQLHNSIAEWYIEYMDCSSELYMSEYERLEMIAYHFVKAENDRALEYYYQLAELYLVNSKFESSISTYKKAQIYTDSRIASSHIMASHHATVEIKKAYVYLITGRINLAFNSAKNAVRELSKYHHMYNNASTTQSSNKEHGSGVLSQLDSSTTLGSSASHGSGNTSKPSSSFSFKNILGNIKLSTSSSSSSTSATTSISGKDNTEFSVSWGESALVKLYVAHNIMFDCCILLGTAEMSTILQPLAGTMIVIAGNLQAISQHSSSINNANNLLTLNYPQNSKSKPLKVNNRMVKGGPASVSSLNISPSATSNVVYHSPLTSHNYTSSSQFVQPLYTSPPTNHLQQQQQQQQLHSPNLLQRINSSLLIRRISSGTSKSHLTSMQQTASLPVIESYPSTEALGCIAGDEMSLLNISGSMYRPTGNQLNIPETIISPSSSNTNNEFSFDHYDQINLRKFNIRGSHSTASINPIDRYSSSSIVNDLSLFHSGSIYSTNQEVKPSRYSSASRSDYAQITFPTTYLDNLISAYHAYITASTLMGDEAAVLKYKKKLFEIEYGKNGVSSVSALTASKNNLNLPSSPQATPLVSLSNSSSSSHLSISSLHSSIAPAPYKYNHIGNPILDDQQEKGDCYESWSSFLRGEFTQKGPFFASSHGTHSRHPFPPSNPLLFRENINFCQIHSIKFRKFMVDCITIAGSFIVIKIERTSMLISDLRLYAKETRNVHVQALTLLYLIRYHYIIEGDKFSSDKLKALLIECSQLIRTQHNSAKKMGQIPPVFIDYYIYKALYYYLEKKVIKLEKMVSEIMVLIFPEAYYSLNNPSKPRLASITSETTSINNESMGTDPDIGSVDIEDPRDLIELISNPPMSKRASITSFFTLSNIPTLYILIDMLVYLLFINKSNPSYKDKYIDFLQKIHGLITELLKIFKIYHARLYFYRGLVELIAFKSPKKVKKDILEAFTCASSLQERAPLESAMLYHQVATLTDNPELAHTYNQLSIPIFNTCQPPLTSPVYSFIDITLLSSLGIQNLSPYLPAKLTRANSTKSNSSTLIKGRKIF